MPNTLIDFSNELAGIAAEFNPNIVSVRARRHYPSSGLRWSEDVVVTADHTVHRDEDIAVTVSGGETLAATLIGRDAGTDLAVLKLSAGGSSAAGPFVASRGRAESVKPGEMALVLGRSPDSGINASFGIISAASGSWRTWRGGQLDAYIRLDVHLFPQSSGGAVLNMRGQIVGLATSGLSRIAGVAVPAATVKRVVEKLIERGSVPRGYLGVGMQPVALSDQLRDKLSLANRSGLIVLTVEPNGPADNAGVLIGDVLVGAGDARIEQIGDLQAYCESGIVGKKSDIQLIRGGALARVAVTAVERSGGRG